ncbi:YMGG-like glycine zipper-containing protein [Rhizobiaceae bacterium BDR2-2]|uniref:YMGG-like glycine zipper-containing protein n=1 Tax=Ectorhizobium quercum TaxID=2965071 RepID=A0AAE3MX91_9HYPH|nr:YMGG-like glycine zipper-containing protein [Ectorhizobium quercum]MCX8996933.1 YMGG-like glycine zipper-containing protein [Ectorhizobium quercum]
MKKALVVVLAGLTLASCTQTERGATIGAASGAIIGGAVDNSWRGAAVGAAVGGAAGAVLGSVSEQPGQCYYRDRYGRRYIDACPRGYR